MAYRIGRRTQVGLHVGLRLWFHCQFGFQNLLHGHVLVGTAAELTLAPLLRPLPLLLNGCTRAGTKLERLTCAIRTVTYTNKTVTLRTITRSCFWFALNLHISTKTAWAVFHRAAYASRPLFTDFRGLRVEEVSLRL